MKKYILENASQSGLVRWLNDNYRKRNGREFTISDAVQYINVTGRIPSYIGGNKIEVVKNKYNSKSYNILSNGEDTD